ncbi:hypothetical protein SLNSH_20145 [Alsobacter soli]|uniref:Flagellar hook-length control protein-like C-terminal domain-containing protein n=1 Tax=Alsobacter soli TaxID=2109933 RepID=A0A2T1HNB8_9HYPH|nr:flagellar hook-length control protein FliK [Alsobacter soli]PSC03150.1 hypothetical protein SLNSH_20145 [Alsobacter soli]
MAIGALSSQVVAQPGSDAGAPALKPGDVIAARVAAILQDGLARLITDLGTIEAAIPAGVAEGATVKLAVAQAGSRLTLRIQPDSPDQNGPTAGATSPKGQAISEPAAVVITRAGAEASADQPPPKPSPAAALAGAVAKAAATQAPPSEIVTTLRAALADPRTAATLPAEAAAAARSLLAGALDGTRPIDASRIRELAQASGLFSEARAAAGRPAAGDAKALMLALRAALDGETVEMAPLPVASAKPAAVSQGAPSVGLPADEGDVSRPADAPAGRAAQAAAPDSKADGQAPAPRPQAPAFETATEFAAALKAPIGDARLLTLALRAALAQPLPVPSASTDPSQLARAPADRSATPRLPPRADQAPAPEPPAPLPAPADLADRVLSRLIGQQVEAALDRVRLSQAASLPAEATPTADQTAKAPAQTWILDIPILLPRETANAQFRIRNEGRSGAAATPSGPAWTIEFAIDTTDSGPIHARLALGAAGLGVTLWAERAGALARLQDGAEALKTALADAAFGQAEVAVVAGAPRRAPPRSGALMDQRT